ncbi:Prefoldin subunit 2 [Trifolium repens]|nr:Prefoldin subunit 2 [Trifolium repens]
MGTVHCAPSQNRSETNTTRLNDEPFFVLSFFTLEIKRNHGYYEPLDQSRRCYRMIGGVLVERTIKEVLPAVQRNKEGLEEVVARLNETLEKKKKEIAEFETKYKIRMRKADAEVNDESGKKEGSAQGVLVGPAGGSE